jgi:ATP-dependent RNA helicase RhlB
MNGYTCEFIVGDLPQSRRLKVIDDVKAGKIKFLVATDVAARGLDIEGLAMVINYDLPNEAENYVHRIGRTARAGKTGRAITLASEQDVYELPAIERYIGKKLPSEIASAELHADDASEGKHISTELYEDRREERHVHGKGVRPQAPNKGRRGRHQADTGGENQHHGQRSPGSQRLPNERHRMKANDGGEKQTPHHEAQDLSLLSFEERMALYKQKYHKDKPDTEPKAETGKHKQGRRRGAQDKQRAAGQPDSQKQPGGQGGKKPAPKKQKPQKPGKQKLSEHAKQKPTDTPAEQKPQQAPEKKGILSRLLDKIKGKKEKSEV